MSTTRSWPVAHGRTLTLESPAIMGILNVTPDSFSDGGRHSAPDRAIRRALEMHAQGAAIIDIGGESTRPGAHRVSDAEQIARTKPVIDGLVGAGFDGLISIDTTRSAVARAAIDAGAHIINDVSAGAGDREMLPLAASTGAGLVLMHRACAPDRDSYSDAYESEPEYDRGVAYAVREALRTAAERAVDAGVDAGAIVLDPGLGFGKSVEQNLELVARMAELGSLGFELLSAASRKSFLGAVAGIENPADRLSASLPVTVAHALAGVRLFRVHDVREQREALDIAGAIMRSGGLSGGCSGGVRAGKTVG